MNHYTEMLYAVTASVTLRFSDKSAEALAEFNKSMGRILTQAAEWWTFDYNQEYMKSKAPEAFLNRQVPENSCGDCTACGLRRMIFQSPVAVLVMTTLHVRNALQTQLKTLIHKGACDAKRNCR